MKPIILRRESDKNRLKEHLNAFSEHDKYLRFGYSVNTSSISKYIDSSYLKINNIWLAVLENDEIIATSHVVIDPSSSLSEFGLTVNESKRGLGIGKTLFESGLNICKENKIKKILLFCLRQNAAMRHIATRFGLISSTDGDNEVSAHIDLVYDI